MKSNINFCYLLAFIWQSWFWLGIWVLYYLRFTNYSGIGLIESFMIILSTGFEIPTGAIADLLGKKKTIVSAFFLVGIGEFIMASAISFYSILLAILVMNLGYAFFSGSFEALIFDSLKQDGKENEFEKIIGRIHSLFLIGLAFASIVGGYLYFISPALPFWITGALKVIGFIISLFLIEPKFDTQKFSIRSFAVQTKLGIIELFKSQKIIYQTLLLVSIGVFFVIINQILDNVMAVEFGFKENQLGILFAGIALLGALMSVNTPKILKFLSAFKLLWLISLITSVSLLISPIVGLWIGGSMIVLRSSLLPVFDNLASVLINRTTQSKYRATTLSTFAMLKNLPYVALAFVSGYLMDTWSVVNFALVLGILMLIVTILFLVEKLFRSN